MERETRKGSHKFYKGRYFLVFYDISDENLVYIFDNVRDILKHQKKEITRQNVNLLNVEIYRALKTKTHIVNFLDQPLRVYIIDLDDDEE